MPYDPFDLNNPNSPFNPNSPIRRQIEEAERFRKMQDLVNPPGSRIMQDLVRQRSAVSAALGLHEAAERRRDVMASVISEQYERDLKETSTLRALTTQLQRDGLLAEPSRTLLASVGLIDESTAKQESLARSEAIRVALDRDRTMASVAAMMNDRLRLFGPDALSTATLSTTGIAAQIAQINQQNEYTKVLLRSQWDAFGHISAATERLYAVPDIADRLGALPGYLALAPVVEPYLSARSLLLFTQADVEVERPRVLDLAAEEVLDDLSEAFEERLAKYGREIVNAVLGAWDVARSESRDRLRQAATSIRTAIEDVIKLIAPMEEAKEWALANGFGRKSVVPEGAKEARSASKWAFQIRYIFRFADEAVGGESDSLVSSVGEADLADMLLLLERLNNAVHTSQRVIELDDLTLVLRRGTALITLLLDAHEMGET